MDHFLGMALATGLLVAASSFAVAQPKLDGSAVVETFSGHKFSGKSPSGKTLVTLTLEAGKAQQDGTVTFTGELRAEALTAGGVNDKDALKVAVFNPKTNRLRIQAGWADADLAWNGRAFTGPIRYGPTNFGYTLQKR